MNAAEQASFAPALTLEPFDPVVFERVWRRVMPDQTLSPVRPGPVPASAAATSAPGTPAPADNSREESPLSCLGERSGRYARQLEQTMDHTHGLIRTDRMLARRVNSRAARLLNTITGDLQRDLRRLSAAYFLITGRRYAPSQPGGSLPGPLPDALRVRFQLAQKRALQARSTARDMADPCLRRLFLDLADQAEYHAGRIRSLLEEMEL